MEEFNSLKNRTNIYSLRELKVGKYNLISLRKIDTKYGEIVIAKLDNEKEYFLSKSSGELSDKSMKKINKGNYIFNFKGWINNKISDYELEEA